MAINPGEIIENVKGHLRGIAGDVVELLQKDNKKVLDKMDELDGKKEARYKNKANDSKTSQQAILSQIKGVEEAVKNQKEVESVSINNPEAITGDLKAGLQGIIEALKTELKNFDKNIVVKNDFSNFASLFKSSQDKKSIIEALKKIEDKLDTDDKEETDYTMILSDIATALEDKEAVNVLKDILAKEFNFQFPEIMPVDLDPNLIEDDRLKVVLRKDQVASMNATASANNRPILDTMTNGDQKVVIQTLGEDIGVQNPLSNNVDSLYYSDIDVANSDNGGFSGVITDYFDSLKTINTDASATNPKYIKVWFKRSIQIHSIGLGCDDLTKGFKNIKIMALGSGEEVRYTKDLSTDSTKRNSYLVELPPLALNGALIEFHTADEICLSNIIMFKANDVNSRIKGVSSLDGAVESITTYRKALDINNAWKHRKIVNETYHQHTGTTTNPSAAIDEGDTTIAVDSVTGLAVGSEIKIEEDVDGVGVQEIGLLTITDITALVITVDRPIGNPYTTAATVEEVISNMAVAGTLASPQIFEIDPPLGTIWQFTRILISITDASPMDDGIFGGIPALTNGVALRATTSSGRTVVFANWKTNGDMALDMFDVDYVLKAPAGQYGLRGRWTFTNAEVVAELDGDASPVQKLEVLIQDDLTDLLTFTIRGQGRVESP